MHGESWEPHESDWELNDLTTVEESFQQGDLRDGLTHNFKGDPR